MGRSRLFDTIGLVLICSSLLFGASNIVLSVTNSKDEIKLKQQEFREFFAKNRISHIDIRVQKSGDDYLLMVGPIEDDAKLASILFKLKKKYPSAFTIPATTTPKESKTPYKSTLDNTPSSINTHTKDRASSPSYPIKPVVIKENSNQYSGDMIGWLWWLSGFGILLLIIFLIDLYISSVKVARITRKYEQMQKKQKELEQRQSNLLSDLGESVYTMSKDVLMCTQSVISEVEQDIVGDKLKHVMRKESKLLNATEKLLRFLKLKAHKVEIKKETFNINSMLDDAVGPLVSKFRGDAVEVIFNLDRGLPKYLVGDLTQMGEICTNLLEHMIEYLQEGEVILEMASYSTYNGKLDLQIKIIQNGSIIKEEVGVEEYFVPYFDDVTGEYKRLGLFVADSLIQLMGGKIALQNVSEESKLISISIPIDESKGKENYRKYPLPERSMIEKDVYIVNHRYDASKALKNMFAYFRHNVTIDTVENFRERMPDLEGYDILLIEESLVYDDFARYLKILKRQKDIKIVGLSNIFADDEHHKWDDMFDKRVKKPLNQERVYLLIIDLYRAKSEDEESKYGLVEDGRIKGVRREKFIRNVPTTPNITVDSFADFRKSRILIVEDNEINMKMILRVLENSGIELDTAENGREAVEKIIEKGPESYDLVLMDINMPIMDGYRATEEILMIPGSQKLPIVALTALSTESEIERMARCGMRAYLPKPLHLGKLYTIFKMYLKYRPQKKKIPNKSLLPTKLDGIDIEEGLRHVDNNLIIYQEILEEFLQIYGDSGQKAMKYLSEHRLEELKQLNLDVMGLAGTIGAKEVYHASYMIHRVFGYNKLPLLQHYVRDYQEAIERVKRSIKLYLSQFDDNNYPEQKKVA